jgi:hypothetical protein
MQKRIRDELDAAIGPFPWKVTGKGDHASCGGDLGISPSPWHWVQARDLGMMWAPGGSNPEPAD